MLHETSASAMSVWPDPYTKPSISQGQRRSIYKRSDLNFLSQFYLLCCTNMANQMPPDQNRLVACTTCKKIMTAKEFEEHEVNCAAQSFTEFAITLGLITGDVSPEMFTTDQSSAEASTRGQSFAKASTTGKSRPSEHKRKPNLAIIVTGPELSGKSTLTSQLMLMLGYIFETKQAGGECPERISGMEKMLEKLRTWYNDDEIWNFDTDNYSVTTNDIPGGDLYTKTMIRGAFKADCALLVIDASTDHYKGYFDSNNAQKHSFLAFTLGVKQMVCCLNKMDATEPPFAQSRYQEVKTNVSAYLMGIGYDIKRISFIPLSALYGDNVIERSNVNLHWYSPGLTVVQAVNRMQRPNSVGRPLRMPIDKDGCIRGRVETGTVKLGMLVSVGPPTDQVSGEVKELELATYFDKIIDALPGDVPTLKIQNVGRADIRRGCVVSNKVKPAKNCVSFQAEMYVMIDGYVKPGFLGILECHTSTVSVVFSKLLSTHDGKTGRRLRNRPESIDSGEYAQVELVPAKPLIVETASEFPRLGRFLVRDIYDALLGIGVIKAVLT